MARRRRSYASVQYVGGSYYLSHGLLAFALASAGFIRRNGLLSKPAPPGDGSSGCDGRVRVEDHWKLAAPRPGTRVLGSCPGKCLLCAGRARAVAFVVRDWFLRRCEPCGGNHVPDVGHVRGVLSACARRCPGGSNVRASGRVKEPA